MNKRADTKGDSASQREKLIGLGKRASSKSYYPELRARLEELEHFRALLDSVNDAIIVVDVDTGAIVDVSGSTHSMLKCDKHTLYNTKFQDLLPPHIARFAENIFQSQRGSLKLETELCCPHCGCVDFVPVEMTLRVVTRDNISKAVIVARDISERKSSEEALRKSYDELEIRVRERTRELDRANRAKSEFLSVVSHELRTPLTSVIGFAKIIRKKLLKNIFPTVDDNRDSKLNRDMSRVKQNIDVIISEGDRLTALINDVLDLAKLEANKVDYNMEPVRPNEFVEQSIKATAFLFENAGLPLFTELAPDLPLVWGDRNRLIQVMVNLFSNAVKFTEHGSITCRARVVGDHVRISVIDTGQGIPLEQLDQVFDKFVQAQETLSDRVRGTGLGLPICRNIVLGHGGLIWAESKVSQGSKFVFTLPVMQRAPL